MKRSLLILLVLLLLTLRSSSLFAMNEDQSSLMNRVERDYSAIQHSREGLADIIAFMNGHPELFPKEDPKGGRFLGRSQRMALWRTWQTFLDHMLALDLLGQRYSALQKHEVKIPKKRLFYPTYAIFLAQYRYALDFISIAEHDPGLHILLNEPVPEIGLPRGAYSDLKFAFLNVQKGTEFALMDLAYRYYGNSAPEALDSGIAEDRSLLWEAGRGEGPSLTLKNALKIIEDFSFKTWLPVQAHVAEWMGDVKVRRPHKSLITQRQISAMLPLLRPGDLLLTRHEWYLSNIGLPGFWPHAALYIGTPRERKEYFAGDRGVKAWVKMQGVHSGDLEVLLNILQRETYLKSTTCNSDGVLPRIIEAKSEGVSLSSLESTAAADSLVVLRPLLPRAAMARAILRAFHYRGRPYDFNFDFLTDSELVCTELVYKAYEPDSNLAGLDLPLTDLLGRKVMTANDIARIFDMAYGTKKEQFDLILFLDGHETDGMAHLSNVSEFRDSWKRPKWHILLTTGHNMR